MLSFFFFQAEDGIRDGRVTGVQTCALPIWCVTMQKSTPSRTSSAGIGSSTSGFGFGFGVFSIGRSEERRVGKECRYWRLTHNIKKKLYVYASNESSLYQSLSFRYNMLSLLF